MGEETQSEHYGEQRPPTTIKTFIGVVRGFTPPPKLNTTRDPTPSQTQRYSP